MSAHPHDSPTRSSSKARVGLAIHTTAYLLVNALLIAINLATSTGYLWFIWPLLGWGIGLLAHALAVLGLPRLLEGRVDRPASPRG